MSLPDWLQELLPGPTAQTWEQVAPVVPAETYLGGGTALAVHLRHRPSRDLDFFFHDPLDLDQLVEAVRSRGPFATTQRAVGTLNGLFGETRLQFLQCGIERPERRLEPTTPLAGLHVAGLGDLMAMKLNAIAGRAQLRDYFDLMTIEQKTARSVEEGLALYLARYEPAHADSAIIPILLGLGYLGDVADDPFLPVERGTIARYWQERQPQIVAAVERDGIARSPARDLPVPGAREPPSTDLRRERGPSLELEW